MDSTVLAKRRSTIRTETTSPTSSASRLASILRSTLDSAVDFCHLREFHWLRVSYLFAHSVDKDPFVVRWRNEQLPVPIETAAIVRLVIGSLVVRLQWNGRVDSEPLAQIASSIRYISMFSHLQFVEIERVHLMMHPHMAGRELSFELDLVFNEKRCLFETNELLLLLQAFGEVDASFRDIQVAYCVEKWRREGRLKRAELHVGSHYFRDIELILHCGSPDCSFFKHDAVGMIISHVMPYFVDALHLTYEQDQKEEYLLCTLKAHGVLARLKTLSITFAYDVLDGDRVALWPTETAVSQVLSMLRTISDSLSSIESLTLRFTAGSERCPSSMFTCGNVLVPNVPLPRLVNLECVGLPCMPFIVSVVSRAPNLRRLSVGSQLFECDPIGIGWISALLDSVDSCPRLSSLHITVDTEDKLSDVVGTRLLAAPPSPQSQQAKVARDTAKVSKHLADVEAKLQALHKRRTLTHLVVTIDAWQYRFIVNNELGWNNVD